MFVTGCINYFVVFLDGLSRTDTHIKLILFVVCPRVYMSVCTYLQHDSHINIQFAQAISESHLRNVI